MKILLIDTFEYLKGMNKCPTVPVGLVSLATILTKHGHEVEIVNFNYLFLNRLLPYDADPERRFCVMAQYMIDQHPDVAGFTSICSLFHNALQLSRVVRQLDPNIKILFGGPHVSSFPDKILARYHWIDAVCVGEAEHTIIDIVTGLVAGRLDEAAGVAYRNGETVVSHAAPPLIEDLDSLPMLDFSLIPAFTEITEIPMETGRGCPFQCIYCSTSGFWQRKFRVKSIDRICHEIEHVKQLLAPKEVFYNFIHDNFTTNYEFTTQLCRKLQLLDIQWGCGARVDTIDDKLIEQMAQSGCRSILIGLETASPAMQKYVNKNLDLDKFVHLVDVILQQGITLIVSFIYGFPPETEADLRATLRMIDRLLRKGVYCHLHSLGVLFGTPLYDQYHDQLVLRNYYSDLADSSNLEVCLPYICQDKEIFAQFYTLPNTVADRYCLLDKFVNLILIKLLPLFPVTFAEILTLFDNEILDFYNDFMVNVVEFADFIYNGNYNQTLTHNGFVTEKSPLSKYLIGFLTTYINQKAMNDLQFRFILHRFCEEKTLAGRQVAAANSK